MQQRQPRLGDILDDYCTRERRLTNHVVVAMVGADVKQTRCTTCDAEHVYKHAKVPRQRRKADSPAALYSQVLSGGPKRVVHESGGEQDADDERQAPAAEADPGDEAPAASPEQASLPVEAAPVLADAQMADAAVEPEEDRPDEDAGGVEEGPVHRRLIRAALPRVEGQPPPTRPAPDFTIRQPAGRQNRFRPRQQRETFGQQRGPFSGDRSNGNVAGGGPPRGGAPHRPGGSRPPQGASSQRFDRRQGHKRSK